MAANLPSETGRPAPPSPVRKRQSTRQSGILRTGGRGDRKLSVFIEHQLNNCADAPSKRNGRKVAVMKSLLSNCLLALAIAATPARADSLQNINPVDLTATFSRAGLSADQVSRLRNGMGLRAQGPIANNLGNRRAFLQAKNRGNACDYLRPQTSVVVFYTNPIWYDPAVYNEEVQNYYQPGYQWGIGLRANSLGWDGFIPYLKQYIAVASPVGQDAFRDGFVAGFGGNAEAIFDRAARQASR
jgi:hypothetical protein